MFRFIILLGAIASLSACATFTHKAEIETLPNDGVVFTSPSVKTMIFQDPKKLKKMCLGRGADAVFETSDQTDFSITLISLGNSAPEKAAAAEQAGEEEMTGRSPGVLMARELFYRACELTNNAQLKDDDAIKVFNNVLQVVRDGWIQEGKNTKIIIGEKLTTTTTIHNSSGLPAQGQTAGALNQNGPKSTAVKGLLPKEEADPDPDLQ